MQLTDVEAPRDDLERRPSAERSPGHPPSRGDWYSLLALLAAASVIGVLISFLTGNFPADTVPGAGQMGLFLATGGSAAVLFWQSGQKRTWVGTRVFAAGIILSGAVQGIGVLHRNSVESVAGQVVFCTSIGLLLLTFLAALFVDFFQHIRRGKAALLSDAGLVAILTGGMVYVLLRNVDLSPLATWMQVATALIAVCAVLVVAGWGVLTLWCPSPVHFGLFGVTVAVTTSAITFGHGGSFGWVPDSLLLPEMAMGVSLLVLAAILVVEPTLNAGGPRPPRAAWWIRPVLLGLSLCAASALLLVSLFGNQTRLRPGEAVALAVTLLGTVGLRAVVNQLAVVRSSVVLERTVEQKDDAIASLQAAGEVLATSEARHRLLLESAVDGVVELDAHGTIVRANAAFCSMVGLPMREVMGRRWADMAAHSRPGGESLRSLPETSEAILVS